jgi:hypothetical protein
MELISSFGICRPFGVEPPSGVHLLEQQLPGIVAVVGSRIDHIAGSSKGGAGDWA